MEINIGVEREIETIEQAIKSSNKKVHLVYHQITDTGAKYLAEAFNKTNDFIEIHLGLNQITDKGVKYLAQEIYRNNSLIQIHLNDNQITDFGANYLADALLKNRTLTEINLEENQITDRGAEFLAEAVEKNKTIRVIDLYGNKITDTGAKSLVKSFNNNHSLTEIDLGGNEISENFIDKINEILERNKKGYIANSNENINSNEIISNTPYTTAEDNFSTNHNSNSNNVNQNQNKQSSLLEIYKVGFKEINFSLNPNKKRIVLSRGLLGIDYLAEYKGIEISVNKILSDDDNDEEKTSTDDLKFPKILMKELELMFRIRHPNLKNLIAYAQDEENNLNFNNLYILSEYFKLGDLFKVFNNKNIKLTMEKKLEILRQISSAVRYLHELNPPISHRAIKSSNVLVSSDLSKVCLNFFGLCEELSSDNVKENKVNESLNMNLDQSEEFETSLRWKAPELLHVYKDDSSNNTSTDVYSFGIFMWEVLTRKIPYNDKENDEEIMKFVLVEGRPDLADILLNTPHDATILMQKCWDHNKLNRPTMKEVTETLTNILKKISQSNCENFEAPIYEQDNKFYLSANFLIQINILNDESYEKINKILKSSKCRKQLFNNIIISDIIPINKSKTEDFIISQILTKTSQQEIEKSKKLFDQLKTRVKDNIQKRKLKIENLFENIFNSKELAIYILNEIVKRKLGNFIIFKENGMTDLEQTHNLQFFTRTWGSFNRFIVIFKNNTKFNFDEMVDDNNKQSEFVNQIRKVVLKKFPEIEDESEGLFIDFICLIKISVFKTLFLIDTNLDLNEFVSRLNEYKNNFGTSFKVKDFNKIKIFKICHNMFDPFGNFDFASNASDDFDNFNNFDNKSFLRRGGLEYHPPKGWKRIGLKVFNQYDSGNNDWLGVNGSPNEWAVGFHGLERKNSKVTDGIYFGNKIEMSIDQNYSENITIENKEYQLTLECRLNPQEIQILDKDKDFYILNSIGGNNLNRIRPYGLLIREKKTSMTSDQISQNLKDVCIVNECRTF